MRFIVYLAIICSTIYLSEGGKYADECKGIEGATADDLKQLAAGTLPAAKSGKCFIACNLEKLGITAGNKLSKAGTLELVKVKFNGDPGITKSITKIVDDCATVTDSDRCEAAGKIMVCAQNSAATIGLNFFEAFNAISA